MGQAKKKKNFAKIPKILDKVDLIEVQKKSFKDFLQQDILPENRKFQGLQSAFIDVFPVYNADESLGLEFVKYVFGEVRYTEDEAIVKDVTYVIPLKAVFRLVQKDKNGVIKEIAEQEVFLCDIPVMTENATFIFNGAERIVVSQLHRSPGVIFEEDIEKNISSYGKKLFYARIIPYRGAWVEFEFDINNVLFVRIDKKRKILISVFLRALGIETNEEIMDVFYKNKDVNVSDDILNSYLAKDVVDKNTGEVLLVASTQITNESLTQIKDRGIKKINIVLMEESILDIAIINTLSKDILKSKKEAVFDIYKKLRAQEYITPDQAEDYFENLLFKNVKKYDFTKVGRYKINKKFKKDYEKLIKNNIFEFNIPNERKRTLTIEDIIVTIKHLIALNNGIIEETDDIDHLGNRRVRAVGELLENQVRIGLSHIGRLVKEKMNMQDKKNITPRTLINSAPLVGIIRKFFGTSQLSQFMDQINPLAELTHKRRLSALGPGGLNRKRAGFEVRDVHYTHYGRICPVETPEGPNIGLITSLSCYAKVNEYGLIESPYRKVENGVITDTVHYLTADREDEYTVAQSNSTIDDKGKLKGDLISARNSANYPFVSPSQIDYIDISPLQVVSPSSALIPFLEHDDANRALMGSNMQRQAVPLMLTQEPYVGTGVEGMVATASGAVVSAKRSGEVISVTADQIVVWCSDDKDSKDNIDIYKLKKYRRTNQDTCINQFPLVKKGDKVKKGESIADGAATKNGQLALGKDLIVAFMPWQGYNFEDAILLSERIVREDVLTSIHILEYEVEARDLKMGVEEITRDIPNISEEALRNLDELGIIRVGAEVVPGDILVGKVTPKGEQQTTPEERLLKVIFGKKAEDVQDASLIVPPGVSGKILDIKILTRNDKFTKKEETKLIKKLETKYNKAIEELREEKKEILATISKDKKRKKSEIDSEKERLKIYYKYREKELKEELRKEKQNVKYGDELPITVNKLVKVYIAAKRKIAVGDKLAGRHGNKGVVAKILAPEDMPYMPNGTPVDIVLNPLSVPSRMNVGQIMELMLGWAGINSNTQMITPVFDGASEEDILEEIRNAKEKLKKEGFTDDFLPDDYCRIKLHDGRTGEEFTEKVTVGAMYILKLAHLVEDKIHARSTGPYSLITRQPLGGKAQFGGQRLGEMEVWAIEGYGASHTLQEFLTVKSDDVAGRTKMYEAIIKGDISSELGIPESFKVLVKELQGLSLNIELLKEREN